MTDRITALEFAFEKLVGQLHETGMLDATQLAEELEGPSKWLRADNEGTRLLVDLADRVRGIPGVYGNPRPAPDDANEYPAAEWELMAQLMIQYLEMQDLLDGPGFASYLDQCGEGMRQNGAPLHLQGAVRRLRHYSQGTHVYQRWLRDSLSPPTGESPEGD